ncbi:MAG: deoxyribonuclease IV [Micromonosporaceae bacterium]
MTPHPPLGVQAPTAGGLATRALPYADRTGAQCLQVFVSNPRGWALSDGDPAQDEAFVAGCEARGIPRYVHATLLINLGSPTPATVVQSVLNLEHALRRGATLGASGVVFHAGSAVQEAYYPAALTQVGRQLRRLLDTAAEHGWPRLLVEPSAGGGRSLAATVQALGPYLDAVDFHPWLGVCLDTCHAYAAGHDLAAPGGMTRTLDELVATVGAGRLALVHANDSRDGLGSTRDRHENIGAGQIGAGGFGELLAHPAAAGVPVLVETPANPDGSGHATDLATLRALLPRTARV